ncbi:MAG: carboxymuconolactone decarboxylase family protein [Alphaproteobacteria bacterium]
MAKRQSPAGRELPSGAATLAKRYPEVWEAYAGLGERAAEAGPLSPRERRLTKLALAIGEGSEGAVHSHVRRGLAEGLSHEDFHHIAVLAVPTLGLPAAMRAMTWIDDIAMKPAKRSRQKR